MDKQVPPMQPRYDSIGDLELHVAWLPDVDAQTNIKNVIQLLCCKLSLFGEDSLFIYINKSQSSHGHCGSDLGKGFLRHHSSIPKTFQQFCESINQQGLGVNSLEKCTSLDEHVKEEKDEQKTVGSMTLRKVTCNKMKKKYNFINMLKTQSGCDYLLNVDGVCDGYVDELKNDVNDCTQEEILGVEKISESINVTQKDVTQKADIVNTTCMYDGGKTGDYYIVEMKDDKSNDIQEESNMETTSESCEKTQNMEATSESCEKSQNMETTEKPQNMETTSESCEKPQNMEATSESCEKSQNMETTPESCEKSQNTETTSESCEKSQNMETTEKPQNMETTSESCEKPQNTETTSESSEKPQNMETTSESCEKPQNMETTEKPQNMETTSESCEKPQNTETTSESCEKSQNMETTEKPQNMETTSESCEKPQNTETTSESCEKSQNMETTEKPQNMETTSESCEKPQNTETTSESCEKSQNMETTSESSDKSQKVGKQNAYIGNTVWDDDDDGDETDYDIYEMEDDDSHMDVQEESNMESTLESFDKTPEVLVFEESENQEIIQQDMKVKRQKKREMRISNTKTRIMRQSSRKQLMSKRNTSVKNIEIPSTRNSRGVVNKDNLSRKCKVILNTQSSVKSNNFIKKNNVSEEICEVDMDLESNKVDSHSRKMLFVRQKATRQKHKKVYRNICNVCGETFKFPMQLRRHRFDQHYKKFKCTVCNAELRLDNVKRHFKNVHNMKNIVVRECQICKGENNLPDNEKSEHKGCLGYKIHDNNEKSMVIPSTGMSRDFIDNDNLNAEVCKVNLNKENVEMPCSARSNNCINENDASEEICEVDVDAESNKVDSHSEKMLIVSQTERRKECKKIYRFTCNVCGETFKFPMQLRRHRFNQHHKNFKCTVCNAELHLDYVKKHFKNKHNMENIVVRECRICKGDKKLLDNKKSEHKGCLGYKIHGNKEKSMVIRSTRKSRDFVNKENFNEEVCKVNLNKENVEMPCSMRSNDCINENDASEEICEVDMDTERNKVDSHSEECKKIYQNTCNVCGEAFKFSTQLRCHRFNQHYKKFKCNVCNAELRLDNAKRHFRNVHNMENIVVRECQICKGGKSLPDNKKSEHNGCLGYKIHDNNEKSMVIPSTGMSRDFIDKDNSSEEMCKDNLNKENVEMPCSVRSNDFISENDASEEICEVDVDAESNKVDSHSEKMLVVGQTERRKECKKNYQNTCNVCGKTFKFPMQLRRHRFNQHYKNFKCTVCNAQLHLDYVKRHFRNAHNMENIVVRECRICKGDKKSPDNKKSEHKGCLGYKIHDNKETSMVIPSTEISRDFIDKDNSSEEMCKDNLNKENVEMPCSVRSNDFINENDASEEICEVDMDTESNKVDSHSEECKKIYQNICNVCGETFKFSTQLRRHRFNQHYKKCKCTVCNAELRLGNVRRHFRNVHNVENLVVKECQICKGEKSLLDNEKSEHKGCLGYKIHDSNGKSMVIPSTRLSRDFVNKDNSTEVMCKINLNTENVEMPCSMRADDSVNENDASEEICEVDVDTEVNKVDSHSENILHVVEMQKKTRKIHQEIYRNTCHVCGETFKFPTQLRRHRFSQHYKKFKCTVCNAELRLDNAKRHFKNVHNMGNLVVRECDICKGEKTLPDNEKSEHKRCCLGYEIHGNNEKNKFKFCYKVFRDNDKAHSQHHSAKYTFQCTICKFKFVSEESLKSHHLSQHSQYPSTHHIETRPIVMQCYFCDKDFTEIELLKEHISSSHKENKIKFQCKFCNLSYTRYLPYKDHVKLHNFSSGFSCHVCQKVCQSAQTLKAHLLQHLPNDKKPHRCDVCGKGFPMAVNLRTHMTVHQSKQYICHICGHACRDRTLLMTHCRSHTGERPYKCNLCGKSFRSWSGRKQHELRHRKSQKKEYMCDICGKCFTQKASLINHKPRHLDRVHHLDKTQCKICKATFTTVKACEGHFIRHHLREEQISELGLKNVLKCEYCGKLMECQEKMKRHIRTHTGEKPHACHICDRAFADERNLRSHIRVHNNDRKHKCSFCGKGFIQRTTLKYHKRSCHGVDEDGKK